MLVKVKVLIRIFKNSFEKAAGAVTYARRTEKGRNMYLESHRPNISTLSQVLL